MPAARPALDALPDWPAAMREVTAAAYLDMSPGAFRARVMPQITRLQEGGMVLYRRRDLDAWLDRHAIPAAPSMAPAGWDSA